MHLSRFISPVYSDVFNVPCFSFNNKTCLLHPLSPMQVRTPSADGRWSGTLFNILKTTEPTKTEYTRCGISPRSRRTSHRPILISSKTDDFRLNVENGYKISKKMSPIIYTSESFVLVCISPSGLEYSLNRGRMDKELLLSLWSIPLEKPKSQIFHIISSLSMRLQIIFVGLRPLCITLLLLMASSPAAKFDIILRSWTRLLS